MTGHKILIVGLGALGWPVLEFLARTPGIGKITTADINEDAGLKRTNSAMLGSSLMGFYHKFEFVKLDVRDVERTVEVIKEVQPDVVFNNTSLQSWWVIGLLPHEVFQKILAAGYGPWLPMHLTLTYKLMQAVKKSGVATHVVSACFPDAVNAILGKVGLAPTTGIGNAGLIIPHIQKVVSEKLKVPRRNVMVFFNAHHFHAVDVFEGGGMSGAPYFLKILVCDKDVTSQLSAKEILSKPTPMPAGAEGHYWVASSAVNIIMGILNDTGEITVAPGPNGLPGGYNVRLSSKGVEVVLPQELTLEKAIKINEEAQKFDGIEKIKDDGTVVFTERATKIMQEMIGYDCKEMKIEESEKRAKELGALFRKFAEQYT